MKEKWLYTIVWGNTTSELCEKVNKEYLKFGWELQGGVSQSIATTLGQDRKIYTQALTTNEKTKLKLIKDK